MLRSSTRPQDIALNESCRSKDIEGVRQALSNGANPRAKHTSTLGDMCPILYAALSGSVEIGQILLENNCDVNQRSEFDNTIGLHHAAANGHEQMVRFLVENGCNINHQDKLGRTALMEAAEIGDVGIVDYLLEVKADAVLCDKSNNTALSYCVDFASQSEENFLLVSMNLVKAGDSPDRVGKYIGRTILHSACARGDLEFVQEMVEVKRANVNIIDYDGQKPMDYARSHGHAALVAYLEPLVDPIDGPADGCPCTLL